MNKRALYRRLHHRMRHVNHLSSVWVTFDIPVPLPVPRWTPGPEWIEASRGRYWIRPQPAGRHEIMVLVYDRDLYTEGWDGDEIPLALVSAVISQEDPWFGTFADKPHRIYSGGFVEESVAIQSVGRTHPAVRYNQLWRRYQDDLYKRCEEFQPPLSKGLLWTSIDVQIKPDGSGWFFNLRALPTGLNHHAPTYWADLADLTTMLGRLQRHYNPDRIYVQRWEQGHFTDPLWQPAMAAIKNAEERSS